MGHKQPELLFSRTAVIELFGKAMEHTFHLVGLSFGTVAPKLG